MFGMIVDQISALRGGYISQNRNQSRKSRRGLGHSWSSQACAARTRVSALVELLEARTLLSAIVTTDQQDYAPGSTANITATSDGGPTNNFLPGETVQFHVTRTDGVQDFPPGNEPWSVTDGVGSFTPYQDANGMWWYPDLDGQADGKIHTTWNVDSQYAGASLELTAMGQTSGEVATTPFTDGTPQIQSVSVSPISPNQSSSAGIKDSTNITAVNSGNGTINDFRIRIHAGSAGGPVVREFEFANVNKNATVTATWDGKDSNNGFVSDGTYIALASTGTSETSSPSGTVVVDNTNPTLTPSYSGTLGNNSYYTTTGQVALAASDATSGVASTTYALDGGSVLTYSGPFSVTGDGTHSVNYTTADNAANVTTGSYQVKIDTTAPTASLSAPVDQAFEGGTIGLQATASDSNLDRVDFLVDEVDKGTGTLASGVWSFTLDTTTLSNASHTWMVKAFDLAGNTTTPAARTIKGA
jgi:hypothetical protein